MIAKKGWKINALSAKLGLQWAIIPCPVIAAYLVMLMRGLHRLNAHGGRHIRGVQGESSAWSKLWQHLTDGGEDETYLSTEPD